MSDSLWLVFLALLPVTLIPRASFIVLGDRLKMPESVKKALRFAPAAAISAIVLPAVLIQDGQPSLLNAKVFAALVALLVAWRTGNAFLCFILGMLALYLAKCFGL